MRTLHVRRVRTGAMLLAALVLAGASPAAGGPPVPPPSFGLAARADGPATVYGRVAQVPGQHMIQLVERCTFVYFDLPGGGQIVVYMPVAPPCPGRVRLSGRVLPLYGSAKRPGDPRPVLEYQLLVTGSECLEDTEATALLESLADPGRSRDAKREAEERVAGLGKAAIPELVARTCDTRTVWVERRVLNEAECINAPAGAPVSPRWADVAVSLGERCDRLLRRIITPEVHGPAGAQRKPRSASPEGWFFRVADWAAWWDANRARSLEEIREAVRPVVERYWQENGKEQVLR